MGFFTTVMAALRFRAGSFSPPTLTWPAYRANFDTETTHRARVDTEITHRARIDSETTHRVRVDAL